MSFRADRYWWAFALGALSVIGIMVAEMFANLTYMFAHGASAGLVGQIGASAVFVLFALAYALYGLVGRRRWHRRRQAIEGDRLAVLEARIAPDVAEVFDVSRETLVLPWRASAPYGNLFTNVLFCAAGSIYIVSVLAPLAERVWSPPLDSLAGMMLDEVVRQPYLVAILWTPIYFILARFLRDRLTIIEATDDGIRFQPVLGHVRFARWQDFRLLEVAEQSRKRAGGTFVTRSYGLYSQRHIFTWVEWGSRLDLLQPEGITWDEMWALSRELVDVIYQRTGLTPRTFNESLQQGQRDSPMASAAPA
ncbi:MAG: hypothetical protein ACRDHP_01430 [Ktedonobacterales bacterium]